MDTIPVVHTKSPLILSTEKNHTEVGTRNTNNNDTLVLYILDTCEKNQWIIPSAHKNILHLASQHGNSTLVQHILERLGTRLFINMTIDDKDPEGSPYMNLHTESDQVKQR